jgi:hypothetical protein
MTAQYGAARSPEPPDLSRAQVIDIYKQAGDAELRRHTPILQTDGKGFIGFLCGCGQTYSHDAWWKHISQRLAYSTSKR